MDFLNPELILVGNRCYRFFESTVIKEMSGSWRRPPYVEDNDQPICEEQFDDDIDIVPCGGSTFKHTFHVPRSFFPFIIGSKNSCRQRLEKDTGTTIQIPGIGRDGDIVIKGSKPTNIKLARIKINFIIEATRKRMRFTHFLSIPLNDDCIVEKFNMFKNDVLTKELRSVEETFFKTPSKLHLTIGMLKLLDDAERNQAIEALNYCNEHIIKPTIERYGKICIRLEGIEIMNDDPTEVKVLYAKPIDSKNVLQKLADDIANYYASIGLIAEKDVKVKLHVTLMNTSTSNNDTINKIKRKTFDAREILQVHKDTFFGETVMKEIHISQIGTMSSDGYYEATAKISLLEN